MFFDGKYFYFTDAYCKVSLCSAVHDEHSLTSFTRHTNHTQIYIERCQKLGIAAHSQALSKIPAEASDGSVI